jgi:hypothetical protein
MIKKEDQKKFEEFQEYLTQKGLSQTILKKFLVPLKTHFEETPNSFSKFWDFTKSLWPLSAEEKIHSLNNVKEKDKFYRTLFFVADWSYSYMGPGEILLLLVFKESRSGGKRFPDLLFNDSSKRIEIKSYEGNFRLTESTYFFTDLGTIIQALVQGGFLLSLTDINNNDLRKGIRQFCESFLCQRGFIELNSKIWRLESKTEDTMVFKISPETSREIIQYSVVRNSIRNWLSRGTLSIKLGEIIDPTRSSRILKGELQDYVKHLLGLGDKSPIPLEQYFSLCGIDSMILYEKKNKKEKFQLLLKEDLNNFTVDRIGQSKVSYKKKKRD